MAGITRYLQKLKVKVNTDKSKVVRVQESSFLGFTFKGKKPVATIKAVMTFKHRLKRLAGRSWGISMQDRYRRVHGYVTGWMNYFGIGMRYTDAVEPDHWLRRRIRMCYLKRWGRARKRIGELIRLGAPKHQAILTGFSRKGYRHLAKDVCDQLRIIKGIPTEPGACFSSHAVDWDSLSGLRPDDFFEPPRARPTEVPLG
ncbi:MAG: Group II intron, maturase-specific domain [Syntrophorhabdus sp. PtaB.Bin006]|nr:MAG: Group II intron, maturase-specific domain [Syntrophorhabdus sp. PtaB.Bin006]